MKIQEKATVIQHDWTIILKNEKLKIGRPGKEKCR